MNNLYQLTREDIEKNKVDTIDQYKILQYLKKNLNISAFKVYLFSKNIIKIEDIKGEIGYFKYNEDDNDIVFLEEL